MNNSTKLVVYGDTTCLTYLPEHAATSISSSDVAAILHFIEYTIPTYISVEVINHILNVYGKVDFESTDYDDIFLDE